MNPLRPTRALWLLPIIAGPVIFTLATGNIWEDFFFTYRCSLNGVHSNGLVYEVGQRVRAITSPLGVRVQGVLAELAGTDDPMKVMALFRVVAFAGAALFWGFDAETAAFPTNAEKRGAS